MTVDYFAANLARLVEIVGYPSGFVRVSYLGITSPRLIQRSDAALYCCVFFA